MCAGGLALGCVIPVAVRRGAPFTLQRLCELLIDPRRQVGASKAHAPCMTVLAAMTAAVRDHDETALRVLEGP